eukprot:TRINITY_DN7166_c0_g1_i3.p1 TRINITY_DN7166_c0_g1~~TRINITY_DN7166_c0_g1_i3.p1  ORF type:complete len:245 (-),score=52.34 TRINITY_DN7166_c0_g1_i3:150-884(-)
MLIVRSLQFNLFARKYQIFLNNQKREEHLFYCLDIPSDELKIEVLKCFLNIDTEQFDYEEINHISNIESQYKNVGVGQTETIISLLCMIMCLFIQNDTSVASIFIHTFAENAIKDTLTLHSKNMARNLDGDEDEQSQQIELAVSCIYFLEQVSASEDAQIFLTGADAEAALLESLKNEESNFSENTKAKQFIPIEIEKTWIGQNIGYLLKCLQGNESVNLYTIISYRIVSRIADILQGLSLIHI